MRGRWTTARATLAPVVLATLAAASLAACGRASSTAGGATTSGKPVKGGTLTVAFQGDPTTLDPAVAWDIESWSIERLTYQTFLTFASASGDAGTELVPDLATEVPTTDNGGISDDHKVYTFHLRKDVTFAPPISSKVTAEDCKWSFERMMKQPLAPAKSFYTGIVGAEEFLDGKADEISGYEVVDPYTVRITLEKPDAAFLMAMTMPFTSVMSEEWCANVGKQIKRKPLGTGPYVITEWKSGQYITAERNGNWTEDDRQWVDEMRFDLTAGPSTALLKLERGEVDLLGDPLPTADYVRTKNDPIWSRYLVSAEQIAWCYVFINVRERPFDDRRVRQAVNYAIDTAKIEKLLKGQGQALSQIYPEGMPGHQADATFYAYDPEKARELLADAGYPGGFATTFVTHNADQFPKLAQAIQADLKAVGIDAAIKEYDRATYWDSVALGETHAAIGLSDWYEDFPDPSDWIGPLFTAPADGSTNLSFYDSAEVDSLYTESAGETDPAARVDLFEQMQAVIMTDAPTVPLYQPRWNAMYGKTTGGVSLSPVWIFTFQNYWKTNGT